MKRNLIYLLTFFISIAQLQAQLKIGDQPTIQEKSVALDVKGSNDKQGLWLPRVSDTSNTGINGLNPPNGMLIFFTPTQNVMVRRNNSWVSLVKTDTTINNIKVNGITSVTGPDISLKVGNNPGTFNDVNLEGSTALKEITINLPDASTTARGIITTGAQTVAGLKTLSNGVVVNNGSTLNNGTIANGGLTVSGATTNTSSLTLGVTSATAPAAQTDRYLSVNATGNVTLNSLNAITSVTAGGLTMTGPALTQNTGTAGTDFNISSTGNIATWNLPSASTTARGAVTTAAQSFAGQKTFTNGVVVNNGSTLNNGTTANGGLTVSGATTNTSSLILGVTSATAPAAQTDRYLSVNASGNVTLNTLNAITSVTAGGLTMTGPALTQTTGTGGTDFNISTSGNTATWNLPDASTTARGAITTGSQSFAGQKTFVNGVVVNNGALISGSINNVSNLKLGVNSLTAPGAPVEQYLTVNTAGEVTLNSVNVLANTTIRLKAFGVAFVSNHQLPAGSTAIYNFSPPVGTTLSINSVVSVSPVNSMDSNFRINWSKVLNSTTIELCVSAGSVPNNFNPGQGMAFRVSVIEF